MADKTTVVKYNVNNVNPIVSYVLYPILNLSGERSYKIKVTYARKKKLSLCITQE